MKIAQLINCIGAGGSGTLVYNLSMDLVKNGHSVDIILLNSFTGESFELNTLRKLRKAGVGTFELRRNPGYNLDLPGVIARFFRLQRRNRYDVIHSHSHVCHFFVGLLKRFVLFQHLITVHSSRERWTTLTQFFCKDANIACCSEAAANGTVKIRKPLVINNGVKFESPNLTAGKEPSQLRQELGIPLTTKLILGVGNLRKEKNYGLALRTIEKLVSMSTAHEYHYAICGDGPERAKLESLSRQLCITKYVSFLGIRSDIPNLLYISDCFLSTSEFEGLPMAVLEAFASGICCVLSPIPEHVDISADIECCCLSTSMEPLAFALAIISSTEKDINKLDVREKRNSQLQKFSWEHCLLAYEELYKNQMVNETI